MNIIIKKLTSLKFLTDADIDNLQSIYSPRTGIINAIMQRNELRKYGLSMFQSLSANITTLFDRSRDVSSGGLGVNFTEKEAFWGCIGESIERYCMSYYNETEIIRKKWINLPLKNKPKTFDLYTDDQYKKNTNFRNPMTDEIDWIKIQSYNDKDKFIYYPASLVYLPYEASPPVAEVTSTGVAAYSNLEEALKNAILEIIERDAIMINFTMELPLYEIDITNITNSHLKQTVTKIRKCYRIRTFKLQTDIKVPVFISVIWRTNKDQLHYGIGACADLNSDTAILKSLKECLFTYFYSKDLLELKHKNKEKINTLYEHFLYYQDNDFYKLFDRNINKISYIPEHVSFNDVLKSLKENKIEIYYKELTTSDIYKSGIKVVRVIMPQMIDLNKSHSLIRKNARRFYNVPTKLGHKNVLFSNLPHPFP